MWLYILVLLILIVLALILLRNGSWSVQNVVLGAAEPRPVLVFTAGGGPAAKQLKSALQTVQTHLPVYNPTRLGEYSNVPVIWTSSADVGGFQRAHPGVCGGAVLWYPSQVPADTIPESTFVVQDLSKQGTDSIWEACSHHRYYVTKSTAAKHLREILASIR